MVRTRVPVYVHVYVRMIFYQWCYSHIAILCTFGFLGFVAYSYSHRRRRLYSISHRRRRPLRRKMPSSVRPSFSFFVGWRRHPTIGWHTTPPLPRECRTDERKATSSDRDLFQIVLEYLVLGLTVVPMRRRNMIKKQITKSRYCHHNDTTFSGFSPARLRKQDQQLCRSAPLRFLMMRRRRVIVRRG
jgi:hypothetical protein